jgi:hypothetical protein
MSDEQLVKNFFVKKPGYVNSGLEKISQRTGVKDLALIKRIRKEAGQEYRGDTPVLAVKKTTSVSPELLEQFKEFMASQNIEVPKPEASSFIRAKAPLDKEHFTKPGTHLVMGCSHIPFHNKVLHEGIRELMIDIGNKMSGFHIIGDFLDINSLSSHDKGKFTAVQGLTLDDEYYEGNVELDKFMAVLPETATDKSFIYGNHEDRVNRFNTDMQNAKAPARMPHDALSLRVRGFSVHEKWSQDYVKVGNLEVFHGVYYNIHNAKKHLDTFGKDCMYVHTHRTQMYREGEHAAYNIGACADFNSRAFNYASRAMKQAWANGFAIVNVDSNGQSYVTQIDVRNSKFYYNGKKY